MGHIGMTDAGERISPFLNSRTLLLVLAICALLILISGIGGVGVQRSDWQKHDLIFRDLIDKEWPVQYEYLGKPVSLVYYVAFYLPPALLGKLTGWYAGNMAWAVWGFVGLLLGLLWVIRLSRAPV